MVKASCVWVGLFLAAATAALPTTAPTSSPSHPTSSSDIFESSIPVAPANAIDRIVFAKLESMKVAPVLCSDAVFVRRVYLDVTGTLPSAKEARAFIQSTAANKRSALIDRLLETPEYADYGAMKWGDALRIKAEFPVNLWPNAAQAYYHWVRDAIVKNKPYDQFVRELLTSGGSNFRVGPVNFYRAIQNRTPEGIAGAVALTFLGSRVEGWSPPRREGMAVFFSQIGYKPTREWKEEIVFWDPLHTGAAPAGSPAASDAKPDAKAPAAPATLPAPGPVTAVFPDGTTVQLSPERDPREVFADWLITPRNPWFARCAVNRAWAWLLGRGIIHEPDDIRDDNPPSNPELLALLEKEFVAGKYDLKKLYRLILNSRTYQLSSMPRYKDPQAAANFAAYPLRRLDAEVLIDAINQITGTSDLYTSPIPEPFTYIPQSQPSVAIADGSITSPFLALFGRSARATGMWNERDNKPVPAQWLHMLNSTHIQMKLMLSPRLKAIVETKARTPVILEELYLTILSRLPTAEEVKAVEGYMLIPPGGKKPGKIIPPKRREEWNDIIWALINSEEFLYRH